jgi:hypothetical protein
MTAPAFIYTSEPWAALSFGRPIFAPALKRKRMSAGHLPQSSASRFTAVAFFILSTVGEARSSDCGRFETRSARKRWGALG